jgi:hypothetical protein
MDVGEFRRLMVRAIVTDGNAVLRLPTVGGVPMLEIAVAGSVPYIVVEELALAS